MPTELFRAVLTKLPFLSLLALKYVSRTIYNKMKNEDGKDFIDMKHYYEDSWEHYHERRELHRQYCQLLISKEAETPSNVKLERLTCSRCHRSKENSPDGFDDSRFKRTHKRRMCLECRGSKSGYEITVKSVPYERCQSCRRFGRKRDILTPERVRKANKTMLLKFAEVYREHWPIMIRKFQHAAVEGKRMCFMCLAEATEAVMVLQIAKDVTKDPMDLRGVSMEAALWMKNTGSSNLSEFYSSRPRLTGNVKKPARRMTGQNT